MRFLFKLANEHHRSVGEVLRTYSSRELTHWMVFFYLQHEEMEADRKAQKTGIRVLNAKTPEQEMTNVMKVLGIHGKS